MNEYSATDQVKTELLRHVQMLGIALQIAQREAQKPEVTMEISKMLNDAQTRFDNAEGNVITQRSSQYEMVKAAGLIIEQVNRTLANT